MRYLPLFMLALLISSCASSTYQVYEVHTPCRNFTNNFVFESLRKALVRQDFVITEMDYSVGLMVAETEPEYGAHNYRSYRKQWKFIIEDSGNIIAKARIIETRTNDLGVVVREYSYYLGDQTHPENVWYWSIRSEIENICQNQSQSFTFHKASAVVGENEEMTSAFILGVTAVAIDAALEASDD